MSTKLDSRQITYSGSLLRVATTNPTELDNIIASLDAESKPPLMMRADTGTARQVTIDALELSNPETGERRTIPPINDTIPSFTSGTLLFPTTTAGTVTVTPGSATAMPTMVANEVVRCGVFLNDTGNLELSFGTVGASEAAAGTPPNIVRTFAIGQIIVRTDGSGNIQDIPLADVVMYIGGGSGSGGGGGAAVLSDLGDVTVTAPQAGDILQYSSLNSRFENVAPTFGDVSDFPNVDYVVDSNFDLQNQLSAFDERGNEVTAPSTLLLRNQTDPAENGIYSLTSFKVADDIQITGSVAAELNGKQYSIATYTDFGLDFFGSTPASENTTFDNVFDFFTDSTPPGNCYLSTDNLSVIWFSSSKNAWFATLYSSPVDLSDSSTYGRFNLQPVNLSDYALWITNASVTDIASSSITALITNPDAVISRSVNANTAGDFLKDRKVKSAFDVYRYNGISIPVLGTTPLTFDLFSTQFDEKIVSGNVGALTGGLYKVNSGVSTTFGALKNVTLFIENTEVTFDSITDCKIVINNQGGDNVTFTGEINNSDIICHAGDTTSQVEFQNSINYSKILGTQTSNSISCYYVTNFTTSWTAFRSNFNILGSIVFRTAPGPVQFTQSIIKCSNVLTVNPGSTFQTDFYCSLDINNIAATYADANTLTINGRGNIQTISWTHGLLDLKGLLRIGRINRSSGSNTPSILRASSAANVNVATVSVVNPDSLVIETFGNSILEIGFLESVSGPANIDGNFANGVIKINYLEEKTFDTQVPAQAMNIVASYGRKIWWTNAGVFGTDP